MKNQKNPFHIEANTIITIQYPEKIRELTERILDTVYKIHRERFV